MTAKRIHPSANDRAAGLSSSATSALAEAGRALSRGQVDVAEQSLTHVLALAPGHAQANRLMGIALQMRGDHAQAIHFLRQALERCPDDAMIHMNLGSSLYESGKIEAALASLQRACELAPEMAAPWYNLSKALLLQFHAEQARDALQRALVIDPTHISARISLAEAQTRLGDTPAAMMNYRDILRHEPDNPKAWFALANLKTESFDSNDVSRLQRLFRRPGAKVDARILTGFALAKALEDQDDCSTAFEVLREANALKRRCVDWDAGAERTRVNAIMDAFAESVPSPLDVTLGREVIFIVSLPRSGSTLVEQILASHSQVEGANEITDLPQVIEDESKRRGQPFPQWVNSATAEDWARLGRDYLARTERWRQRRPRFTDKNLINWQLVGAALAMLPGARVVDCHRDALETCFGCYRQLFSNGAHFSYDLNDMANHYLGYDRLRQHWQRLFPQQVLDYEYELLLTDTESRIRRLLDFCGLEFEPACLAFHQTARAVHSSASAAQVRQPLRADTSRSARYGDKLDQLRAWLHAAG